jgi:CheY-like chemotaxis protein
MFAAWPIQILAQGELGWPQVLFRDIAKSIRRRSRDLRGLMPTVLLVEDDPGVRLVVERALADRGLEVRSAADDRTARRILEREARQIDLLIADVHLGASGDGYDVARRARKLNPLIEVVYITGRSLDADRFVVSGGVLMLKPFDLDNLADVVQALTKDPA